MEAIARVLFLSTRNSARSQMAEAFMNRLGAGHFEARSVGLEPGELDPFTKQVMSEIGYDLAGQRVKGVREYLGKVFFRHLIILCGQSETDCPRIWPGISERFFWPVEDPKVPDGAEEETLAAFREVRDQIRELTQSWVAEMTSTRAADGAGCKLMPVLANGGSAGFSCPMGAT